MAKGSFFCSVLIGVCVAFCTMGALAAFEKLGDYIGDWVSDENVTYSEEVSLDSETLDDSTTMDSIDSQLN